METKKLRGGRRMQGMRKDKNGEGENRRDEREIAGMGKSGGWGKKERREKRESRENRQGGERGERGGGRGERERGRGKRARERGGRQRGVGGGGKGGSEGARERGRERYVEFLSVNPYHNGFIKPYHGLVSMMNRISYHRSHHWRVKTSD